MTAMLRNCLLTLMLALLVACGGNGGTNPPDPAADVLLTGLPPLPPAHETAELVETWRDGSDTYSRSVGAVDDDTSLRITALPSTLDWAVWQLQLTGVPHSIDVALTATEGSAYIALADYAKGRWDITAGLTGPQMMQLRRGHVSSGNCVYMAVLVYDGDSTVVERLTLVSGINEWPMFGCNPQHTRRSPYVGAQTDNKKWSFWTKGFVSSSPAIGADGTVYFGSGDDKLYAINPDGSLKWAYTTGDSVSSPAIGADGTVYVGSWDDNKLYAINPDGSLKWAYSMGGSYRSFPTIGADGTVYVGSRDNKLYAINPDGSLRWSYTTGGDVISSPAIGADGTVYVGSRDSKFYAINPDGSLKWSCYTWGNDYSSPAIDADGTVYVGSGSMLCAINPDSNLKWSYRTSSSGNSSPAIGADGTVYVGSWDDNKLYAINPDGSLMWSYTTEGYVSSSPAIGADGTVYVGSWDGRLHAVSPDGNLKWSRTLGYHVHSSPAIGMDGTVFVGGYYALHAFGPTT